MAEKWKNALAAMAFGARATPLEAGSALAFGMIGIAIAVICGLSGDEGLELWQWAIIAFVAFDVVGGVAANSTVAATYQYHRPNEPMRPLIFSAGHVHPFALVLVVPSLGWDNALIIYLTALIGTAGVILSHPSIKRGFGLGYCAIVLGLLQLRDIPSEFAWFAPAFLLKLVAGHAFPMWESASTTSKD